VFSIEDMEDGEEEENLMNHILYIDEDIEEKKRDHISWLEFWVYMCKHGEYVELEDY